MFIVDNGRAWRRAKDKAAAGRPAVKVLSYGSYSVEGSGGNYYGVTVRAEGQGTRIDCTCLAGVHDKPCYHGAAALTQHLAFVTPPVAPPRDKRLGWIEGDLRFIARRASEMGGDFEIMDDICRAVRSALQSLGEYEIDLMPEVGAHAA